MPVGREVLPESVENPLFADRGISTGNLFVVHGADTFSAVESTIEGDGLEPAYQVTIRLTTFSEDQGRTILAGHQASNQVVRNRYRPLLAVFGAEPEVRLFQH